MAVVKPAPATSAVASAATSEPRLAQTLDRGLAILQFLAQSGGSRSTAEIACDLGVHRSIAHRLLTTLERRALVARNASGSFELGLGLVALAAGVESDLRRVARPYLEELAKTTGETVHLVVRDGADVLFLDGIESPRAVRVATRVGRRLPAHATSVGKALLAELDPETRSRFYRAGGLESLTDSTVVDPEQLESEIDTISALGFAVNREESEELVGSVGVAIGGPHPIAISVATPIARLDDDAVDRFVGLLRSTKTRLARELAGIRD